MKGYLAFKRLLNPRAKKLVCVLSYGKSIVEKNNSKSNQQYKHQGQWGGKRGELTFIVTYYVLSIGQGIFHNIIHLQIDSKQ